MLDEIGKLAAVRLDVAASIRQLVEEASRTNPAILISMDASLKYPRERVYPLNMEVPLAELNLLSLHAQTMKLLAAYKASTEDRTALYSGFEHVQRLYLACIAGVGAFLGRAKARAWAQ